MNQPIDRMPGQVWIASGPRVLIIRKGGCNGHQGGYLYTEGPGTLARGQSLSIAEADAFDLTGWTLVTGPAQTANKPQDTPRGTVIDLFPRFP